MKRMDLFHLITASFLIILCITALLIWPFGLISIRQETDPLQCVILQHTGPITEDISVAGILQAPADRLDSIGIWLTVPHQRDNQGTLHFQLKDAQGALLCTDEVPLREMTSYDYNYFTISQKLQAGEAYIFELTCSGAGDDAPMAWLGPPQTACIGQAAVYYGGAQIIDNALIMQLVYHDRASFFQSLPYELTLIALAVLVLKAQKGA